MKILFLQHMNGMSGSELYLLQFLPFLKERGIDAEVLIAFRSDTGKNKFFTDKLNEKGVKVHEVYGNKPYSYRLILRIKKIIKSGNYDLVQSNLIHADLWVICVKCFFMRRLKIISVKHGFDEEYSAKYGFDFTRVNKSLFVWVQRVCGFFINKNVTISKGLYDLYTKGRISKVSKTTNVYYGLDLSEVCIKEYPAFTSQNKYVTILGRLVKYKGHEYLIKAWRVVSAKRPDCKLYIIGDGDYRTELEDLARSLQLNDHIIFLGFQSNPHRYLRHSNFTVVTSIFEGFGLIILESWSHSKPVIAFDVPAMNEIIDNGKNGALVPLYDIDQLAGQILNFLENEDKTNLFGHAGFKKLNEVYTLERMTTEMIDIYNSVLN